MNVISGLFNMGITAILQIRFFFFDSVYESRIYTQAWTPEIRKLSRMYRARCKKKEKTGKWKMDNRKIKYIEDTRLMPTNDSALGQMNSLDEFHQPWRNFTV